MLQLPNNDQPQNHFVAVTAETFRYNMIVEELQVSFLQPFCYPVQTYLFLKLPRIHHHLPSTDGNSMTYTCEDSCKLNNFYYKIMLHSYHLSVAKKKCIYS
jgi:hypothetical protein